MSSISKPVYSYVLQIIIVANHMSGKDTHVRGLRVLGPLESAILSPV
jgi:anaphase-promoting complex subunit 10